MLLVLSVLAVLLVASNETRKEWLVAGVGYAMSREVVIDDEFKLAFGSTIVLHAAEVRYSKACDQNSQAEVFKNGVCAERTA